MEPRNFTVLTEFILLGFSHSMEVQITFFVLFLLAYTVLLLGNLLIIFMVKTDSCLASLMNFLLCNLSFIDICYSSITTPRMLADLFSQKKTISYHNCMAQLFLVHFVGATEMFLLIVMAYDHYIAICKPLHYITIMNRYVCYALIAACWVGGFTHSIVQTGITMQIPFCGPNIIDNYFCDVAPVIKLSCTDTYVIELLMVSNSGLICLVCFLMLLISYIIILVTVRFHFTEGKWKALSTCASHVMVVTLFFGPCIFIYLHPFSNSSADKVISLINTILTPMLNPLIYTLRNKDVKDSMMKLWSRCIFFTEK
ncbi:olfactory receptor 4N5-like [Alligator mississippiensis]|uniref:olfactory receptor 4N5-like n=1 Tax=Alligator mississippiensis TaxID=8496 RepID=UPI0003D0CE1A|nr:olfactory receptor 4N5-like [Alligator mississippiensis]